LSWLGLFLPAAAGRAGEVTDANLKFSITIPDESLLGLYDLFRHPEPPTDSARPSPD
jgi:hypothetical protein